MTVASPLTSAQTGVKVYVADQATLVAHVAGYILAEYRRIAPHRRFVLGTATGGTMEPLYEYLTQAAIGIVDGERVEAFGLDSYRFLPPNHPQQYHYFMNQRLWGPLGIPLSQRHLPDDANAAVYDDLIRHTDGGGIDLQLLGIGPKEILLPGGHAGFNEAGSTRDSKTRIVQLAEGTLRANAKYFGGAEFVPKEAVTMGMSTILDLSSRIVLLAFGSAKAEAIRAAIEGPMHSDCPSSFLQGHRGVSVFIDHDAAALLEHTVLIQLAA